MMISLEEAKPRRRVDLPKEAVEEFMDMCYKEYGLKLTYEEAKPKAENFLRFFMLAIK